MARRKPDQYFRAGAHGLVRETCKPVGRLVRDLEVNGSTRLDGVMRNGQHGFDGVVWDRQHDAAMKSAALVVDEVAEVDEWREPAVVVHWLQA